MDKVRPEDRRAEPYHDFIIYSGHQIYGISVLIASPSSQGSHADFVKVSFHFELPLAIASVFVVLGMEMIRQRLHALDQNA
jgi:hypothetical protein